jgi:hypothetical protein
MSEKLAGIIASVEEYKPIDQSLGTRIILRPKTDWSEAIVVGRNVKLVLANGDGFQTRVRGFTLNEKPEGALVDEIPNVDNEDLLGARLYVLGK